MIATATLAALLAAAAPLAATSAVGTHGTATLVTFTQRDVGSRRYHTAIALAADGTLVGHVLTRPGRAVCRFTGAIVGGCVRLDGCGFAPTPVCP